MPSVILSLFISPLISLKSFKDKSKLKAGHVHECDRKAEWSAVKPALHGRWKMKRQAVSSSKLRNVCTNGEAVKGAHLRKIHMRGIWYVSTMNMGFRQRHELPHFNLCWEWNMADLSEDWLDCSVMVDGMAIYLARSLAALLRLPDCAGRSVLRQTERNVSGRWGGSLPWKWGICWDLW